MTPSNFFNLTWIDFAYVRLSQWYTDFYSMLYSCSYLLKLFIYQFIAFFMNIFIYCSCIVTACSSEGLCQRRLSFPSSITWHWALLFCPPHHKCLVFCVVLFLKVFHKVSCVVSTPHRFFHKHHEPCLGCLWSWNSWNRLLLLSGIVSTGWVCDWLTEQCVAALMHHTLTQAEEKIVPMNRISFRQDLSWLVTFQFVSVNDIHYLKWLKYQKYWKCDLRMDFRA